MHHLEKIPNLHELQWNLSSFTKSKTRHTLGLFKILREPLDIFGWGFLRPVSNTCDQIWPVGGHLTLTVGHSGSQGIHGAFLLRLSVLHGLKVDCTVSCFILLFLCNWALYWFTAIGSETVFYSNRCSLIGCFNIWFDDRWVQARFFVSYLTLLRVVRYEQRIWVDPDSLLSNKL